MGRLRIANLVLASALSLGVTSAACTNPPDTNPATDIFLTPDTTVIRGLVADAATLDTLFRDSGLAAETVVAAIDAARAVFDPRRLRSSQPFMLERTPEGAL